MHSYYYSNSKSMQQQVSNIDLNLIDREEYNQLPFDHTLLDTPKQYSNSPSLSFKNNPIKQNHLFSSPLNKTLGVGYLTPVVAYPSLGFTPWTPIDKVFDKPLCDGEVNAYQALNFDQPIPDNSYPCGHEQRTAVKRRRHDDIFKTPANKSKRKSIESTIKRTKRCRKEVELVDYVKTSEERSHLGLRNLASSVKEAAVKLGVSTSKEIAETLIKDLQLQKSTSTKQHQNIKRRVYDALKVLVSADVIIKDNKNLIARPVPPDSTSLKNYRDQLRQKIESVKKSIQLKSSKALTVNNKWVVRQQLLEHNRKHKQSMESRLFFPFLAITLNKNNLAYVQMGKEGSSVCIGFKEAKLRIIGDIDIVLEMRILELKEKERVKGEEEPQPIVPVSLLTKTKIKASKKKGN